MIHYYLFVRWNGVKECWVKEPGLGEAWLLHKAVGLPCDPWWGDQSAQTLAFAMLLLDNELVPEPLRSQFAPRVVAEILATLPTQPGTSIDLHSSVVHRQVAVWLASERERVQLAVAQPQPIRKLATGYYLDELGGRVLFPELFAREVLTTDRFQSFQEMLESMEAFYSSTLKHCQWEVRQGEPPADWPTDITTIGGL